MQWLFSDPIIQPGIEVDRSTTFHVELTDEAMNSQGM
jgi:hypothetical protein